MCFDLMGYESGPEDEKDLTSMMEKSEPPEPKDFRRRIYDRYIKDMGWFMAVLPAVFLPIYFYEIWVWTLTSNYRGNDIR